MEPSGWDGAKEKRANNMKNNIIIKLLQYQKNKQNKTTNEENGWNKSACTINDKPFCDPFSLPFPLIPLYSVENEVSSVRCCCCFFFLLTSASTRSFKFAFTLENVAVAATIVFVQLHCECRSAPVRLTHEKNVRNSNQQTTMEHNLSQIDICTICYTKI